MEKTNTETLSIDGDINRKKYSYEIVEGIVCQCLLSWNVIELWLDNHSQDLERKR
jgi:hypothetical protein